MSFENTNQKVQNQAVSNVNLRMLAGLHTGQVKWFNKKRGYGFITILQSKDQEENSEESFIGKDVFVHQSHIKPKQSTYRCLEENEYVQLSLSVDDKNVTQAVDVTGILGGSLLCDSQNHQRIFRQFEDTNQSNEEQDPSFSTPKYNRRRNNFRSYTPRREAQLLDVVEESNDNERVNPTYGRNYFSGLGDNN